MAARGCYVRCYGERSPFVTCCLIGCAGKWHMCVKHAAIPRWRVCSMEGKNELGKNSAQEDAPRPFWWWLLTDAVSGEFFVNLTRDDWTRPGDLKTDDDSQMRTRRLQQEEEPDFCRQGCVKEDGEE
ncbi:hypothetical protein Bbelb_003880 [Branchiostoma belcheri]|nr:hypothetical protein Bbelb_003880 [Branchiostoma belcheri]